MYTYIYREREREIIYIYIYIRGALVILSHTSDFKHPSAAKQPDPNRVFAMTPPPCKFDCFWPCALSPTRNVNFHFTFSLFL